MKIFVTAKPNAKKDGIEETGNAHFAVRVKAPPQGGGANRAIVKVLAEYLDVAPSRIRLISGFSSKYKIFEMYSQSNLMTR